MSLKAVHLIFVNALTALALGFGVWKTRDFFSPQGKVADLFWALGALIVAILVVVYGRYFLRKLRSVSYL